MKVYIFILKVQNKWGILPAIRFVLCVSICFKSANFVLSQKKARITKAVFLSAYFMILKTERGLFDEFVPRVKRQAHYISRLNSQFVKLENQFSRLKN